MRKRLLIGTALLAFLAGLAVMSFAAPQLQPPGQKYKITLVNGTVMEGEIVAVTEKTISIRDVSLGVIAVARENVLKIEPPLDEGTGAAAPPRPAPAPAPVRYSSEPSAGNGGPKIGFSLSGGLGFINGGDFNAYIRDWNTYVADYNDYYGGDYYTIDWKEMKSMTNFKGEVLARFGRNFGVGLGMEFIKKTNPGNLAYDETGASTYDYSWYYVDYSYYDHYKYVYDQTLSVMPITLSFYYYLPLDHMGEVYFNAGAGYYFGSLKSDMDYDGPGVITMRVPLGRRRSLASPLQPIRGETGPFRGDLQRDGISLRAGFNFNLSENIALFGEAFYRLANFKDWQPPATITNTTGMMAGGPEAPGRPIIFRRVPATTSGTATLVLQLAQLARRRLLRNRPLRGRAGRYQLPGAISGKRHRYQRRLWGRDQVPSSVSADAARIPAASETRRCSQVLFPPSPPEGGRL